MIWTKIASRWVTVLFLALCLQVVPAFAQTDVQAPPRWQGLWRGSWGGGESDDGVVYQPVNAELFVAENGQASWTGLPTPDGTGRFRWDVGDDERIRLEYAVGKSGTPAHPPREFTFSRDGETLVLRVAGQRDDVVLVRKATLTPARFAELDVTLQIARGVDQDGNLLVANITTYRIAESDRELAAASLMKRPLTNADLYRVTASGLRAITLEELRGLVAEPRPVVVAARVAPRRGADREGLAVRVGPLQPDSEAGLRTLGQLLRPGTIVLIVPHKERYLQP